ncbi:MAG: hypothetical protein AAF616_06265 [Bacteroidota bacterium]
MDFDEYLKSKKIDPGKFKDQAPEKYHEWEGIFNQVHPASFTQQKLFLINQIRRAYAFSEVESTTKPSEKETVKKPIRPLKFKPQKPKIS